MINRLFVVSLVGMASSVGAQVDAPAEPASEVVLRIPFAEGERQTVWRGPGEKSHSDRFNRYAVDFSPLAEGHVILSASAGRVVFVKENTAGPTGEWRDNNEVAIRMPNGRDVVVYLHLLKDGVDVKVGDDVLPGDPIGRAGNTGNSEATHLHIDVRKGHRLGPSIPWRFATVATMKKIRAGLSLRSENVSIRDRLAPIRWLRRVMELSASLDEPGLVTKRMRELRAAKTRGWRDMVKAERSSLLAAREQQAARYVNRLQTADATDRSVLAWIIRDAFSDPKAATAAETVLKDLTASERSEAQKLVRERTVRVSALIKALELERKLFGIKKSKRAKQQRKVRKAFARSVRGWSADRAALIRAYAAGI